MEKVQQVEAIVMLILGICLMLEGIFTPTGTDAGLAIVIIGPPGTQKSAQTEFLRRRYRLPVITSEDLTKARAVPRHDGFVLEDYPTTKERAGRLADLVRQRKLAPVVIEIADRRFESPPVDVDTIESHFPEADIWTLDGTLPAQTISSTLEALLDKTPPAR